MFGVIIIKHILCIDLKSFFASCECIERDLDPFKVPLVVANKNQGNGAITLAVTPYLKQQGVKGRTRLYEIPRSIKYTIVNPRMSLYLKKSTEVVSVFLDFIDKSDLHIYSIDECFLDVSNYLHLYNKTPFELAEDILATVKKKTGLTATCGIGPNLLIAKVAMDIEAKHQKNGITEWTYEEAKENFRKITPLSKMWGIGSRMEARLNALGIYTIGDLADYDKNKLKVKFGILGLELWQHANAIDNSEIKDFQNMKQEKSFSHSQVLFRDYDGNNIHIIINEMISLLTARLRKSKTECCNVGIGISYSKTCGGSFYHTTKLDTATDKDAIIYKYASLLFDQYYEGLPIRKVTISLSKLSKKLGNQLTLFENIETIKEEEHLKETIDDLKDKFGKNSILNATSLLEDSTIKDRNKKIGGHHE